MKSKSARFSRACSFSVFKEAIGADLPSPVPVMPYSESDGAVRLGPSRTCASTLKFTETHRRDEGTSAFKVFLRPGQFAQRAAWSAC